MLSFRQEVVDVLFNRDLNLLCRIDEMRKAQKIEIEERKLRRWHVNVGSKSCFASQRRVSHLRELFAGKEIRKKGSDKKWTRSTPLNN